METMNSSPTGLAAVREADRAGLPRCRARSRDRHAGGDFENLRRRRDRTGHCRRPARVRREPRPGGQGQMAAAGRPAQRASNCTSSARCNRTRPGMPWRCSTPSIRSIGQASPRRSARKSPGRRAVRCSSSRSIPAPSRKRPACCRRTPTISSPPAATATVSTISGLMCIPPLDEAPAPHFALTGQIARRNGLGLLSMGMSADFPTAIAFGATHVRVGTAIFGTRDQP